MKKIYTILFFIITLLTNAQTGIISYKVENLAVSDHEMLNKINAELELMEFTLYFNSKTSHFKKEKNIYKDKLSSDMAKITVNATEDYFQFSDSKNSASNKTISGKDYQIDRTYKMTGWELNNESIVINDYTCYKATLVEFDTRNETNSTTIAWYTPEIPIGYGPIGYGGLPGAILQLQFKKIIFKASHVTLNPKKIDVALIEDGEKINYDEMIRLMRAARKVTED